VVKNLKYIDKFLKKLKTDRNTFVTYILTLISIYIIIDRVVEMLFIGFSGISVSYWGPIKYTFALACPVFAFYFSYASKFVTHQRIKISFLYLYAIALYLVALSMFVQWINRLGWLLLFSVPNYSYIISNFMDLIKPAFSALGWYLPVCTFYPLFKWLYTVVNDTKDITDSIMDYPGIDLSPQNDGTGPYTCEITLCKDSDSAKIIKIPESRRYESTLVVGTSGSGKTTMVFEPMIARDLEKKYFFKEVSKEVGFTALRTGIANLNCPYTNEYVNDNFSLNMLTPVSSKEKIFKAYLSKLTISYDAENSIYKNLGLTYLSPDYESLSHIKEVADNFGIKYHIIDPSDPKSIGLNPFAFRDPIQTAIAISSILKRMYDANIEYNQAYVSANVAFNQNVVTQALENLTILLKEMYPLLNDNDLPTLENLLKLLTNFDLIEELAEKMKTFPDLASQYEIQLGYFEKTFYKTAQGRDVTARHLQTAAAQLENLLRYPGIKDILCNQYNNINYDNALKNGDIILVCTRRGDLGASVHKAFGLFVLLLMQHSVLSRPGSEKTRIPHFLYIDEFTPFICKATEDIFTLYRKYRVGTIVSAQNLSQFGDDSFKQTILANSTTKIVFGNNTPDDNDWWQREFGDHREWKFVSDYETNKGEYNSTLKQIKWDWKENFKSGQIQALKFKMIAYKTKDTKGKMVVGKAKVDFLESKYKEKQTIKTYNFAKFTNGINITDDSKEKNKNKNKNKTENYLDFDITKPDPNLEADPVKTNSYNSNYKFDDDDPIINYKKKNNT